MDLQELLVSANVNPAHADQLVNDGWTAEHFALIAAADSQFDTAIAEALPDVTLTALEKASLKLAWRRAQAAFSAAPSVPPAEGAAAPSSVVPAGSWSETHAPKLTSLVVSQLKGRFKTNYPAEVLLPENTPSLRLLSTVVHQHAKRDYKWIAWKYRLSAAKSDELQSAKSSRLAKPEGLQLHAILLDEPPSLDISNGSLGMNALRQMFETFSFAMSMADVAHLASLKAYYLKFLQLMSQKLDPETGLRNATILEAQAADKSLMTTAAELVLERQWTWDDALHEITHIRADMMSLLQPRPRLPKQMSYGKGDSGGKTAASPRPGPYSKGSSKGKPGKGKTKNRVAWVTECMVKGEKKQLCMRFQTGSCSMGDSCKFMHGCAYPGADGQACGKPHGAMQHAQSPH